MTCTCGQDAAKLSIQHGAETLAALAVCSRCVQAALPQLAALATAKRTADRVAGFVDAIRGAFRC